MYVESRIPKNKVTVTFHFLKLKKSYLLVFMIFGYTMWQDNT